MSTSLNNLDIPPAKTAENINIITIEISTKIIYNPALYKNYLAL